MGRVLQLRGGHGDHTDAQTERPHATRGRSRIGASATRWTAPGRWATARRGLRQVRARSRQADALDGLEPEARSRRLVQLCRGRRLVRVEPHRRRPTARTTSTTSRSICTWETRTTTSGSSWRARASWTTRSRRREGHRRSARGSDRRQEGVHRVRRVQRLVSRARQRSARPANPRGTLQPRGRARHRDAA